MTDEPATPTEGGTAGLASFAQSVGKAIRTLRHEDQSTAGHLIADAAASLADLAVLIARASSRDPHWEKPHLEAVATDDLNVGEDMGDSDNGAGASRQWWDGKSTP